MKLIRKSEYKRMPWKNGLGFTDEIAIGPEGAKFPNDPFDWRLSTATVANPGPFSAFNHCDRWLAVIEGNGLTLNDRPLFYGECRRMSGENPVHGDLIDGPVKDLGIIFDRRTCDVEMKFEVVNTGSLKLDFGGANSGFLYLCRGKLVWEKMSVLAGETLSIEANSENKVVHLECIGRTELMLVKIFALVDKMTEVVDPVFRR